MSYFAGLVELQTSLYIFLAGKTPLYQLGQNLIADILKGRKVVTFPGPVPIFPPEPSKHNYHQPATLFQITYCLQRINCRGKTLENRLDNPNIEPVSSLFSINHTQFTNVCYPQFPVTENHFGSLIRTHSEHKICFERWRVASKPPQEHLNFAIFHMLSQTCSPTPITELVGFALYTA